MRIAKDFAVILWVVEKNAIERTFGAWLSIFWKLPQKHPKAEAILFMESLILAQDERMDQ